MRRSRYMIVFQILAICNGGANKSRIVYHANLNFKVVNKYIDLLMKQDLIAANQGRPKLFETTKRGRALLTSLEQVLNELAEA